MIYFNFSDILASINTILLDELSKLYNVDHDTSAVIVSLVPQEFADKFDVSSNIAMVMAKKLHDSPSNIAKKLIDIVKNYHHFVDIACVGAGFINIKLSQDIFRQSINAILSKGIEYGISDVGHGEKINIEYVSANPTGPMHIGHMRIAIYGDVLANFLSISGFNVTREYYINDHGGQVDILVKSAFLRYKQIINPNDHTIVLVEGMYPGEYLIDIGHKILEQYGENLTELDMPKIRQFVIDEMLSLIKNDLSRLGIKHDVFVSERDICNSNDVIDVFAKLSNNDVIYRGILALPKGHHVDDWEEREQSLFKSTLYGDDVDRPIQKSNGEFTYFATDIAYHYNKYRRGFSKMLVILGADHKGYKKRIAAAVNAMSDGNAEVDVRLCELVRLIRDGETMKMSKRAGNIITVSDVLDMVHPDIIRFMLVTRSSDSVINFDVNVVQQQSKDNPVFYIQYAYSRCCSIITKAKDTFGDEVLDNLLLDGDISVLHMSIIIKLITYPRIIASAMRTYDIHLLTAYGLELASLFHSTWQAGSMTEDARFIIKDDITVTRSRLAVVIAIQNTLGSIFRIIGIQPMLSM